MAFNVSIVLTGASIISNNVDVYSNPVTNINHGTFVTTVAKTCLTTNSPCNISVPDGTVTVRLLDKGSYCYWDLPTCSSNVCQDCGLGFSYVNNNQNGTVDIGNLTGSCDNSIDDFRIEWLGPNSLSTTGFTSGKGTQYSYSNTHPLTGSNAPLLLPGNYVSRITNVNLNNVKFSSIDGLPGHVYSPTLSACSTTVTVVGLNCSNGNVPLDQYYKHQKLYSATNPLATPTALSTTFQLDNGQKFFVFEFTGYQNWDIIKLTLTGSSYPYPIVLEDYKIGGNSGGNDYTLTTFPKSTSRQTVRKIITLTGLTITNNDYININLIPNTSTNNTSWEFKFGCRSSISYEKNCLNTFKNKPYRIKQSTLTKTTPDTCQRFYINFELEGCTSLQNSGWINSDFRYLISDSVAESNISTDNNTGLMSFTTDQFYPSYQSYQSTPTISYDASCSSTIGNYTYQKVTGPTPSDNKIIIKFSNITDYNNYQTKFNNAKNSFSPAWNSDNTNINYYKFIFWAYVKGISTTQVCYDGGPYDWSYAYISPNAQMNATTVPGAYPYQIEITTPSMVYNPAAFTNTACGSNSWESYINSVNTFVTQTIPLTTVTSKNITLTSFGGYTNQTTTYSSKTTYSKGGTLQLSPDYNFKTYPANATTSPPTLIPSFSGSPFTEQRYLNDFARSDFFFITTYYQNLFSYEFEVTSFSPTYNFKIKGRPITNYVSGPSTLIYDSSLPNPVVDSSFFF